MCFVEEWKYERKYQAAKPLLDIQICFRDHLKALDASIKSGFWKFGGTGLSNAFAAVYCSHSYVLSTSQEPFLKKKSRTERIRNSKVA